MSENFMPNATPQERTQALESHADSVKDGIYFKKLEQEEIDELRELYVEKDMKLDDLEEQKKTYLAELKSEQDPIKNEIKDLRKMIRTGQREILGKVYNVPDYPNKLMIQYNEYGEFLGSRRLRPEERQQNVFQIGKTAEL